jgi:nucleoside-diphosphate kinase
MEQSPEKTLVLVKPDGVQRGLVGEIIHRLERRGLKLVAAKFLIVPIDLAEAHYAIHKGKIFYESLIRFITSSPVMAMVWEGPDAVVLIRQLMGATRSIDAAPGTVRQDLALQVQHNLTHASDSVENASKEILLWFKPEEIVEWDRTLDKWFYDQTS